MRRRPHDHDHDRYAARRHHRRSDRDPDNLDIPRIHHLHDVHVDNHRRSADHRRREYQHRRIDVDHDGPPVCDETDCALGEHCDPATSTCQPGCNDDADCQNAQHCDAQAHQCVDCLTAADCPLYAHAQTECTDNTCHPGACTDDHHECDGDPATLCESPSPCVCTPGELIPCYSGPDGTVDVGPCLAGSQQCTGDGLGFGACTGEVLPAPESCGNTIDDDCNGGTDDLDEDGDGWSACDFDCCDVAGATCPAPALVNPGAFEFPGNNLDDDCDPGTLDAAATPTCDQNLASNSAAPLDYVRAIDLCKFTTEEPPLALRTWGVLASVLSRADGIAAPYPASTSLRPDFGPNVTPKKGNRLAVFSTGNAADKADTNPGFVAFQPGLVTGADSDAPDDWLAANGGQFTPTPNCPNTLDTTAHDSTMLTVRMRVPTNAASFSVRAYYYTAEYPEYVCTAHNDRFVALLDGAAPDIPADKNLAFFTAQAQRYPINVGLVPDIPNAFPACFPGAVGCAGTQFNYMGCPGGTLELIGTGFADNTGGCANNNFSGGGTGWLRLSANVVPGEVITLRFAVWDSVDGQYDSLILLDDWRWSATTTTPGAQTN